ncbi:MAG: hypothetical protein KDA64_18565 [Rhodospirillaceae bacterium]|nr:hypothetical protein [Rhodospirillaceae bacterium]
MNVRSRAKAIETISSVGHLIFHIFSESAESERSIIGERTMIGLASAKARDHFRRRSQHCGTRFWCTRPPCSGVPIFWLNRKRSGLASARLSRHLPGGRSSVGEGQGP